MPKSNYTTEEREAFKANIKQVKKNLPAAYADIISKTTGKSIKTVWAVGAGRKVDYEVMEAMKDLAKEKKKQVEKLKKELIK